MIVGTAGHIDHGKTALVLALTGVDTDRLPEEKRRGITIDLGFAPLVLPGVGTVGVVDVPGHDAFVRTMVAGATGIDVALLVIAADEGVMPQTREHIAILDLLGVTRGVVALTKSDLVDADWAALLAEDVASALAGTSLAGAPALPVSATTGAGLDTLRNTLARVARDVAVRDAGDVVRLPIDRVFSKAGSGTVVTGTLWSGRLRVGDAVTLLPSGESTRVRGLQTHGATVDVAEPGTRVAVALAGVKRESVTRGDVLVASDAWRATGVLRADVTLLRDAPASLGPRSRVRFHLGTAEVGARVVTRGGALKPGETRPARIVLDQPVVVARAGDRFVLRRASPAATIGGGVVTDPQPGPRRVRPFAAAQMSADERLVEIATGAAGAGVAIASLPIRIGVSPDAVSKLMNALPQVERVADHAVARAALDDAAARLTRWLDDFHERHPTAGGAPLVGARDVMRATPVVVDHVIASLVKKKILTVTATEIRRTNWRGAPDAAADARKLGLMARLTAASAEIPAVRDLEREFGSTTMATLRQLEREGAVLALAADRFASAEAARALWARVSAQLSPDRGYTPSELRPVFGLSRQYLIVWLEYFDRIGHSRRDGDLRRFRL